MALITKSQVKNTLRLADQVVLASTATLSPSTYALFKDGLPKADPRGDYTISRVSTAATYRHGGTTRTTAHYYSTVRAGDKAIMVRATTGSTILAGKAVYVDYVVAPYDSDISDLIVQVQADMAEYLNNYFWDPNITVSGSFNFTTSGTGIQLASTQSWTTYGFKTGMDVILEGSGSNDGIYSAVTVGSSQISVSSTNALTTHDGNRSMRMSRVYWPVGLRPVASQIIWESLERRSKGHESAGAGGMTVQYAPLAAGGYSPWVYNTLDKYRRPRAA